MSQQLHLHSEVKIQGKWYHHNEFCHYLGAELKSYLTGYGCSWISKQVPNRKLPNNLSIITKIDIQQDDVVQQGWISQKETQDMLDWFADEYPEYLECWDYIQVCGRLFRTTWPKEIENFRMIYWLS